jgi:hypothetical protein
MLLAAASGPKAFVDHVLDEVAPSEGACIAVGSGRTCLAALGVPLRRRLLIVDGAPPDIGAGALIESARAIDRELAILLVRDGWPGPPRTIDGVHIQPGPLISPAGAEALRQLLAASRAQR